MAGDVDDLYQRWVSSKDLEQTLQLCNALRGPVQAPRIQQVGEFAKNVFSDDITVLVAVARMFMSANRLSDAQAVLVTAGKVAPRDGIVYRVLGEVLLRRGDADRAEKVLERAVQFGSSDGRTQLWLERAKIYRSMQDRSGAQMVASEIERTSPAELEPLEDEVPSRRSAPAARTAPLQLPDLPAPPTDEPLLSTPQRRSSIPPAVSPIRPNPLAAPPIPSLSPLHPETGETKVVAAPKAPAMPSWTPPPPQAPPLVVGGTILGVAPPARSEHSITFDLDASAPELPSDAFWSEPGAQDGSGAARAPEARQVLEALIQAGVFDPDEDPEPVQWYRPKRRMPGWSSILLAVGILGLIGGGIGVHQYVLKERAKQAAEASNILDQVEVALLTGKAGDLTPLEPRFSKVFDLDSRSERAALLWLRYKTMTGLLTREEPRAIEGAMKRVADTTAGDPATREKTATVKTAFAQLASFVFHGDTAGAVELLPRFDAAAATDAWYQLFAGLTLERAGDGRASERYLTAARLDPRLVVAQVALTRVLAIEGDPAKAAMLAKDFRARFPDRVEGAALIGLAWARNPGRSEEPPPEVEEVLRRSAELPANLAVVPFAIRAIRALDKRDYEAVRSEIKGALRNVDSPGVASWLGSIAIAADDESTGRAAALAAVSFSAIYPPARVLAARVALLGNHVEEAKNAIEGLDPAIVDVALVRAAVAYERVDLAGLVQALSPLGPDLQKLPPVVTFQTARGTLEGRPILPLAELRRALAEEIPGRDLILFDYALDRGDIDSAKIASSKWGTETERPLRALRLSRLARYEGRQEDAEKWSALALQTPTFRSVTERAYVLIGKGRPMDAMSLLKKYPLALGPSQPWLEAFALGSAGKTEDAKGRVAKLDVPDETYPLPTRVLAAAALGTLRDANRGLPLIRKLMGTGFGGTELVAAGAFFGMKPIAARK